MAEVYVDPSTGVDDGATAGTSGDPYATIDYAIANYASWATTSGNTIYLADTAALVLTDSIDVDGTIAGAESPLAIVGWDNGGSLTASLPWGRTVPCGVIDGDNAVSHIFDSNTAYLTLRNLKLHSTNSFVVSLSTWSNLLECEIYNGTTRVVSASATNNIVGCKVYNDVAAGTTGIFGGNQIADCEISGVNVGIQNSGMVAANRNLIFDILDSGIQFGDSSLIYGNTIDGIGADSDAVGITTYLNLANYEGSQLINNLITAFDGGTSKGIYLPTGAPPSLMGNNAFYDNSTDVDAPTAAYAIANITETSSPYTDSASGDFTLTSGALSNNAAIIIFGGDADNPDNVGAWQDHSSSGGGGGSAAFNPIGNSFISAV